MSTETATLGGGCFWCLEAVYEQVDGVVAVESGYSNGHVVDPRYEQVCHGDTGHAEVVRVRFDPARITLAEILAIFFAVHDPTTRNRQGADVGTQYRSAIFFHTDAQRKAAIASKERFDRSGVFPQKAVTEILPAGEFFPAEEYHQDFYDKHPDKPRCHCLRDR